MVQPRINAQTNASGATPKKWRVIYEVLAERPFITLLVILQLSGVARGTATTIAFMQTAASGYARSLPSPQHMALRLIIASVLMAVVTVLWLLGAIGLWRSRSWGWWLALVLNEVAATFTTVIQLLKPNKFLLDSLAMAVVVLLLMQSVRMDRG